MSARRRRRSILVDALRGAASGVCAAWAMDVAQKRLISRAGSERTRERERRAQEGMEPATVRAAESAAKLLRRPLDDERRKRIGGGLVHYATGALLGAIFGALAPRTPARLLAAGTAYGVAVWLVEDELLVPVLGWAKGPTAYPPSLHAKALASHLVYGTATGASYRLLEKVLH